MLTFELLRDKGNLVVQPSAPLQAEDFQSLTATVDPYITERGQLAGLLIEAPSFPGWDSFGALCSAFALRARPPSQHQARRGRNGQWLSESHAQNCRALCAPHQGV